MSKSVFGGGPYSVSNTNEASSGDRGWMLLGSIRPNNIRGYLKTAKEAATVCLVLLMH